MPEEIVQIVIIAIADGYKVTTFTRKLVQDSEEYEDQDQVLLSVRYNLALLVPA